MHDEHSLRRFHVSEEEQKMIQLQFHDRLRYQEEKCASDKSASRVLPQKIMSANDTNSNAELSSNSRDEEYDKMASLDVNISKQNREDGRQWSRPTSNKQSHFNSDDCHPNKSRCKSENHTSLSTGEVEKVSIASTYFLLIVYKRCLKLDCC